MLVYLVEQTCLYLAVFKLKIGRRNWSSTQEGGLCRETPEVAAVRVIDGEVTRAAVVPHPVKCAHGRACILIIHTVSTVSRQFPGLGKLLLKVT